MIEFALVLPLLLILVAGLVEIGRGLIVFAAVERAVVAGARALARTTATGCDPVCSPGTSRPLAGVASRILVETGLVAGVTAAGPRDGIVTVEARVDLEPWAFPGWAVGTRRIAVSWREQHVAP